jgi:hypothetical protein
MLDHPAAFSSRRASGSHRAGQRRERRAAMLTIIGLVLLAILLVAAMLWVANEMFDGGILNFIIFYELFKALGNGLMAVLSAIVDAIGGNK